jgi:CHAD domain-containing protein
VYRDAGRELSAARDAEATIETIDRLLEATDDQPLLDSLRRARRRIDDQRRRLTSATNTAALAERIGEARARLDAWPLIPDDPDAAFGKGRDRTRRAARKALERAEASRSPEDFHELRKRAKDYWYHLRLLDGSKREQQEAEKLSDLLGRQHDLVVAPRLIKDVVVAPIAQRARKELEEKALRAAHRVLD